MIQLLRTLVLTIALVSSTASMSRAAELVMVGMRACAYCEAFSQEVEPTYASTKEGKLAPIRHVHVRGAWPADLVDVTPAHQTPVFILVRDGEEVGRFAGYANPEAFFADLDPLLKLL